jgi:hypothetical protein
MKCSINRTIKALRATGSVFGHLLTALLGTAIIESEFWHILPSSVVFEGSCFKEYFFSTLIPFGLGYFRVLEVANTFSTMGVHRLVSAGLDNERFSIGLSNGDFDYSHWTTRCSLKCLGSVAHNYLQRHLKPLAERLSVEGVTFQALRRTFATLMQRKGPKNAQTQLRHSDIAMTLGTYA